MLLVPCPWCGPRHENEFVCTGEATAPRPRDPQALSDEAWTDWLIQRENRRGPHRERWWHARGCGSWFELTRDTVTHEIATAGEVPP